MTSERAQRKIDQLLEDAEKAIDGGDWSLVRARCEQVLRIDPQNADARTYLTAADREPSPREVTDGGNPAALEGPSALESHPTLPTSLPQGERGGAKPTSFANGRYQVKRFLGEGGKKRVYLAHDTLLDRDVAFALIKTEGLDDIGRDRIRREAQAMGRLGTHPHIVSVFDLGEEPAEATGNRQQAAGPAFFDVGAGLVPAHGQPYIVTELMGGGDVEGLIAHSPDHRPRLERTLQVGIEVCRGLEFAHAHGIVHRDLKPGTSG